VVLHHSWVLRQLKKRKTGSPITIYFSNRTNDIILHDELDEILGKNAQYIVTEKKDQQPGGKYIDKDFLQSAISDFKKPFYLCGPDKMISDISTILKELGADPESVIFEK
jgi:ferredoxin-NADP reductase